AELRRPEFTFQTTPGGLLQAAYAEAYQPQAIPQTEVRVADATMSLAPTQGPVGTHAMLRGAGFPRNSSLQLVWQTSVGSRVSGLGFEPQEKDAAQVKVGSDGKFAWPVTIPEDLGGLHGIALRSDNTLIARAFFVIETSIVS